MALVEHRSSRLVASDVQPINVEPHPAGFQGHLEVPTPEQGVPGCIPLQGCQVNELPANQDEPGRHLFEIVPVGSGEKDRTGISHESFLLMANSQSDMEEWVRAIRRAIRAPLGGGVFGQHLEETMLCEGQSGPHCPVPVLVEQCVSFIRQHGLNEEGLFRAPGQTNHVRELQDAFDRGEKPVFDSTTDIHTVASLLKLYIRELPEPVIPFPKYTLFLSCAQLLIKDKEMGIAELGKQVNTLPQVNYNLLKYICKFLDEVQAHSSENKMSVQNLATVFGPNILRPRVEDPVTMMEGSSLVQHLMTVLISEHSRLYQQEDLEMETKNTKQPQQSPSQRCTVEWVSQDDNVHKPCLFSDSDTKPPPEVLQSSTPSMDSKNEETTPLGAPEKIENCQTEVKGKAKTEGRVEGERDDGKAGGEVAVSPCKQSKTLPSWSRSFKGGPGSGGPRGKMGGSAGDVSVAGGGNWLMNGLSSLRAHKRTASSGERLKDSTLSLKESTLSLKETTLSLTDSQKDSLQDPLHSPTTSALANRVLDKSHRLSAYENVTVAPSSLSLPAETSALWTSFAMSLTEQNESDQGSGLRPSVNTLDHSGSITGTSSDSELGDDIKGQGQGTSEGAANLVAELKRELKRQRIGYENRIRKLEDSCSKYQFQVGRLEEELDQEKKRFQMLEIRLRNSERAHQHAENRNILLQKEMEEFFRTLGDLTTGAARIN
ncbi:rho GTPase-activating protein 22 [Lampris incognitus]|uniref:rho GTPase-activating protein 22 n=1 Tax=Lampris incognitus TaxID=2546036 RepID=UPI0024B49B64|nr:rho GTPase-activating protein 22 [Lampris incognitus]